MFCWSPTRLLCNFSMLFLMEVVLDSSSLSYCFLDAVKKTEKVKYSYSPRLHLAATAILIQIVLLTCLGIHFFAVSCKVSACEYPQLMQVLVWNFADVSKQFLTLAVHETKVMTTFYEPGKRMWQKIRLVWRLHISCSDCSLLHVAIASIIYIFFT